MCAENSLVTERRKYENPPIREAICHFAVRHVDWQRRSAEEVFRRLKDRYDGMPYTAATGSILREVTAEDDLPTPSVLLMSSPDGTRLIRCAADHFAILTTPPYLGWEEYHARIREIAKLYETLFQDVRVAELQINYQNWFTIRAEQPDGEYLTRIPAALTPDDSRYYFSNGRYVGDATVVETFTSRFTAPGNSLKTLSIGIEVITAPPDAVSISDAIGYLPRLKKRVTDEFESTITDNARSLFKVLS